MATDLVTSFLDRYRLAALIQAIEEDLRGIIRQFVSQYVDVDTMLGDRGDEIRRRAVADGVVDPSASGLVDYIDFGDAFSILNRHRGMLPEQLATDVRAFTPVFESATSIRNRVMHGRPLQSDDEERIARLGQALAESDVPFLLTRAVAARLIEEPDWRPFINITSTDYGILHNLPLPEFDETGLLGRDDELRELKRLLMQKRFPVITIAGEGGIGKTALAVQAVYDLVDSPDAPYTAVLWSSLKAERLTGAGIEQVRGNAFDLYSITNELSSALSEAGTTDIELLAAVLSGTSTLVAIDNIESIGAGELRRLIAALPDSQFLFTSRVGLGELEWRITLDALGSNAAKAMIRHLAARRGLQQIAHVHDKQATKIVDSLRRSPLSIRWFVEAVQLGGQPDDLLRDQGAVLQFCMSTIYDSLTDDARRMVECLLAIDGAATLGQLAILTETERSQVQEQIYELQRRALVGVDSKLNENLSQAYQLSAMAREYLERFGSLDEDFSEEVRRKLREIATTSELMRVHDNAVTLEPMAIVAETPEELAVAHLLRQALRRSRNGHMDDARTYLEQARDAAPGYFETYRVAGFIESSARPEEARRQYAEGYRLAPAVHRPRVAYWLAGHLAKLGLALEAEPFAEEAHKGLNLPGTGARLGRIYTYLNRFAEAETLLRDSVADALPRTRLIIETYLLDLAKRQTEGLHIEAHQPAPALEVVASGLERAEKFIETGVIDKRLTEAAVALLNEGLLVALKVPDITLVEDPLNRIFEILDRKAALFASSGLIREWRSRLEYVAQRSHCPPQLSLYVTKILERLDRPIDEEKRARGEVLEYSGSKRYGFIRPLWGDQNVFFHRDDVRTPIDRLCLVRGTTVSYTPLQVVHEGADKLRASDVVVVLDGANRARALHDRQGRVVNIKPGFLFLEDVLTNEIIYVGARTLALLEDIEIGTLVGLDVEDSVQGPQAVPGSVSIIGT